MPSPYESSQTSAAPTSSLNYIAALLSEVKWGAVGATSFDISYSFPWTTFGQSDYYAPYGSAGYSTLGENTAAYHFGFDAVQQSAARNAVASWAAVANIHFHEIAESAVEVGDIRFGWTSAVTNSSTGGGAWGWAYYPNGWHPSGGDIWLGTTIKGLTSANWAEGSFNYESLIHEIGHALGLKHPFEDGVRLPSEKDSRLYSMMAYDNAPNSLFVRVVQNADGSVSARSSIINPDTPMLYDVAAIQHLYGANTSYNAGNNTYTFDPDSPFFRTIWDGGGNDTISVANFSRSCTIDLQAGHFSSITIPSDSVEGYQWPSPPPVATYDGTKNLAIAYSCLIENATGGTGHDVLIGNAADNVLDGGDGEDLLYGGAGSDTAVFHFKLADAAITWTAGQSLLSVQGLAGVTDKLWDIEYLQFDDVRVAVANYLNAADRTAPAVTSFAPANGEGRVPLLSNIVVNFSEAIARGTGTIKLWNTTTNSLVELFDVASSMNLAISGVTLTIDPSAPLVTGASYAVQFEPGSIKDVAGNAANVPAYSFSAPAPVAGLPAFRISAEPVLGEGDVATFTITLDSEVTSPVTIYFATLSGTASTSARDYAGFSDRPVTFVPGGPTSLTVGVETLADALAEGDETFRGVIYRAIGDYRTATYLATSNTITLIDRTAPGQAAPTVVQFSPQPGGADASTTADIVLTFSDSIMRGSGNITIVDGAGNVAANIDAATSGLLAISGATLTINPVDDLAPGTTYQVILNAGTVRDLFGNQYGGTTTYSFTTASAAPLQRSGTAGADSLAGGPMDDALHGLGGHDTLAGGNGSDTIEGGRGNDMINGGDDSDVALYSGSLANYTINKSGSTYTVQDKTGADGTDLVRNVETLRFADMTVNLGIQVNANAVPAATLNQLVELYSAFFLRTPDADGLAHWLKQSAAGESMASIADQFYAAGTKYPALTGISDAMSNAAFIDHIYKNVLGRTEGADPGGMAHWSDQLANGYATRGSLVIMILDVAHGFKGDPTYGYVAKLLENRIALGKLLAVDLGIGYTDPENAIAKGMAISAAITSDDFSQALKLVGIAPADFHLA